MGLGPSEIAVYGILFFLAPAAFLTYKAASSRRGLAGIAVAGLVWTGWLLLWADTVLSWLVFPVLWGVGMLAGLSVRWLHASPTAE